MPTLLLNHFDGGLNLRDAPYELSPNETPDALNWTLDTRGAIRLRDGCASVATLPGVSGTNAFIFYSAALNQWLCVRETAGTPNTLQLYSRPGDLSGSWTNRGGMGTNLSAVIAFADWPGNPPLVVIGSAGTNNAIGANAVVTWDGTTFSVATGPAYALAIWQNRVWATGYPVSDTGGVLPSLFASMIANPHNFVPPDGLRVDLRDKDGQRTTGLGLAGGALMVFKARSAYRVSDSASGAPTTIDASQGAISPLGIPGSHGRLYSWGADGLFEWDGVGKGKNVGDKARPLFAKDVASVGGVSLLPGGALTDRVIFAYPQITLPPSGLLEYDPQHGWMMKHVVASGAPSPNLTNFARKDSVLYAALAGNDQIWSMFTETPGSDIGNLITNNYRTPWLEPAGGRLCRIDRADIEGLLGRAASNTLAMRVYKDGDLSSFDSYDLTTDLRGTSATDQLERSTIQALGHARSFAFEFVAGTAAGAAQVASLALEWNLLEVR